uniref:Uncharacterized protein n=1 Tax=Tanacetum cinerariifolium TaxID=118510 RepID=A0A6L2M5C0_TANCI|nr:hypothetical protein [Tanacetum cinerariifolium]
MLSITDLKINGGHIKIKSGKECGLNVILLKIKASHQALIPLDVPLRIGSTTLEKAVQSTQQWHLFSSSSGNFLHWQWELLLAVGTP